MRRSLCAVFGARTWVIPTGTFGTPAISPLKNEITIEPRLEHAHPAPASRVATAGEALPARRDYFFNGLLWFSPRDGSLRDDMPTIQQAAGRVIR